MDRWLRPMKLRERVDHYFEEAEKQVYSAVIRGDVRARLKGRVLGRSGSSKDEVYKNALCFELGMPEQDLDQANVGVPRPTLWLSGP